MLNDRDKGVIIEMPEMQTSRGILQKKQKTKFQVCMIKTRDNNNITY